MDKFYSLEVKCLQISAVDLGYVHIAGTNA